MGGRKYPSTVRRYWEEKRQTSQCKPVGRPPKKGTKKYSEYKKQKVIHHQCIIVYSVSNAVYGIK